MSGRLRVVVAGAGVFGLASALALLEDGADVRMVDPAPEVGGASGVAAGLLAPVGEAVFDPDAATHYPLLSKALTLWPAFAAAHGIALSDDGLVTPRTAGAALDGLGVVAERHALGLFTRADPRVVDPQAALAALRGRVGALGGRIEPRALRAADRLHADFVVLATGAGRVEGLTAPELDGLAPVKGQIVVLPAGPRSGPTVRWAGGYLAPQPGGARVGATMETGRSDTLVEPEVVGRLLAAAEAAAPGLDAAGAYGEAGVRMQSPDGLPLVGPSQAPGVLIAAAARRNGWLLAPLVGRMIAAYARGEDPGPWAGVLHPGRFLED